MIHCEKKKEIMRVYKKLIGKLKLTKLDHLVKSGQHGVCKIDCMENEVGVLTGQQHIPSNSPVPSLVLMYF